MDESKARPGSDMKTHEVKSMELADPVKHSTMHKEGN
jgi:hypothetical protein